MNVIARYKLATWEGGGIAGFYAEATNVNRPGLIFDHYVSAEDYDALAEQHRGAVEDRDALRIMLKRLLDVALVDGYGETVRDEAETLLNCRRGGLTQPQGAVDAERECLRMILKAGRGDWDRTVPTLEQWAEARLAEIGGQ